MHKREWDTVLYGIAEDQAGYFSAAQARAAGLHQVRLVQLAQQGDIERLSRGVYRFIRFLFPARPLRGSGPLSLLQDPRGRPRACSKDIDIILRDMTADLADALEHALSGEAHQGSRSAARPAALAR